MGSVSPAELMPMQNGLSCSCFEKCALASFTASASFASSHSPSMSAQHDEMKFGENGEDVDGLGAYFWVVPRVVH